MFAEAERLLFPRVKLRIDGIKNLNRCVNLMKICLILLVLSPLYAQVSTTSGEFNAEQYTAANMFTGSILNFDLDTEYECRFTLADPDGVSGAKEKTVILRTRKEPMPAAGGHTYHVWPVDWQGPKQQPAFTGLVAAYYMGSAHFDCENAFPPSPWPTCSTALTILHRAVRRRSRS